MDTVYAEYKELSREVKKYFKYTQSHKFKLELSKLSKIKNENSEWSYNFKASDLDEEESEDIICKCIFHWENRTTKTDSKFVVDECPLLEVKRWFVSNLTDLICLTSDGWDSDMTVEYVDAYLKAVADLELNTVIILEDGFHIECLSISRASVPI